MDKEIGLGQNTCVSTCASTCEKSIYEPNKIKPEQEAGSVIKSSYDQHISINDAFSAREINLENILTKNNEKLETTRMFEELPSGGLKPSDYLRLIESHIPEELISSKNFSEIKHLASNFNNNLTSFFGFETRLTNTEAISDFIFAVSNEKGEREALANLMTKGKLLEKFFERYEWQQIVNFVTAWSDTNSILYDKILGIWFEFDSSYFLSEIPVPCVFLHTGPLHSDSKNDLQNFKWLTQIALSILTGKKLSKKLEKSLLSCIQQLPSGASIYEVGTMLSRSTSPIRLEVKRLLPNQIVPYLQSIGWSYDAKKLLELITDLENKVTRIVLSFDVFENGIGPRIGIECSFYPKHHDQYQFEPRWSDFLNYLVEKKLCTPEKRDGLIEYFNIENERNFSGSVMKPLTINTKIKDDSSKTNLVRELGHIKVIYEPNHSLEAKAYFGGRIYGFSNEFTHESLQAVSQMVK